MDGRQELAKLVKLSSSAKGKHRMRKRRGSDGRLAGWANDETRVRLAVFLLTHSALLLALLFCRWSETRNSGRESGVQCAKICREIRRVIGVRHSLM